MGFGKGAAGTNGTGFQLLVIIFIELFGVSLGQLIAAISPSIQVWLVRKRLKFPTKSCVPKIAVLFNPFIMLVLTTFAGVTIPYPTMAKFWRSWLYQLTPFTRLLSAMLSTELQWVSLIIPCRHQMLTSRTAVWWLHAEMTSLRDSTLRAVKPATIGLEISWARLGDTSTTRMRRRRASIASTSLVTNTTRPSTFPSTIVGEMCGYCLLISVSVVVHQLVTCADRPITSSF